MADATERAEANIDESRLTVTKPKKRAVGAPAVLHSMEMALDQMGPVRTREDPAEGQPGRRLRLPGLRVARPGHAAHRRVLRERREGRRRGGHHPPGRRRSSSPRTPSPSCEDWDDYWLGQAGPADRIRCCSSAGDTPLPTAIAGTRAFDVIADELDALDSARRGRLLHLGPHQQRGRVPLPAVRPRARHEQPARLLEHVPRVERRRADRDDRHRQGHASRSTTSSTADLIIDRRAEPGHQPSAHAHRAGEGEAARRAASSRSTRCPRRGWCGSRTRRRSGAWSVRGTQLADTFLQIRLGGDLALFQALGKRAARAGREPRRHGARPRLHRRSYTQRLRGLRGAMRGARLGRGRGARPA